MNSTKPYHISRIIPIILFSVFATLSGCDNGANSINNYLDQAECLMETLPDSALTIINQIDVSALSKKDQKARYALLKSMALDKNYIDTTNFDVLQPAIKYYLKNGSPDEKLRTYYYQGRIYQNRNLRDSALHSFIRGLDISSLCKDSLTIARTLMAQAIIYRSYYDYYEYTSNCLKAAKIYKSKLLEYLEFDCLASALNGLNIVEDKKRADSVMYILNSFKELDSTQRQLLHNLQLTYMYQFGSKQDVKNFLENNLDSLSYDANGFLNLARALSRVGDNVGGLRQLDYLDEAKARYDTLKYLSIKFPILENLKDYKGAFLVHKDLVDRWDNINSSKFEKKSQSIEEKHQLELQAEREARKNLQILYGCIVGILFLLVSLIITVLLLRSNKAKRKLAFQIAKTKELENEQLKSEKDLAAQKARTAELENANLKSERERLTLENANLQLERDNKALEAENLAHRVDVLEGESESLKALLDSQEEIPLEVQEAIQTRIEMLNSLLAGYITDNSKYEEPYDMWVKQLTENTEEFMNTNRLAFQASHPVFIRYFEEHGLTESEINYVCLYAIGLRGKEVGNYMKKRSHVNISSAIRKKLGIDKHDTNIGIYVRKLLKSL